MKIQRIFMVFISIVVAIMVIRRKVQHQEHVNIYDWYGMMNEEIIQQFEDETGIRVRFDMFDNNDIVEAKLLAGNSGYDVVFPSAVPYAARQIKVGIFQKLQKNKLPNLKNLHPYLVRELQKIDKDLIYVLPHSWGTTGFVYDMDRLQSIFTPDQIESLAMLFSPKMLKQYAHMGVSLLEEPVDIFPLVLRYKNKNPDSIDFDDLNIAEDQLFKARPYIKRFSSSRMINDLILGEIVVGQIWSSEAYRAVQDAKELGRNLKYVIPSEGTSLWIDVIAIPADAPHVENAHKFINFLMRADVSAKLTNLTAQPFANSAAEPLIDKEIRGDEGLYPPAEKMKKIALDQPQTSEKGLAYDRVRTRVWANIRSNSRSNHGKN